MDLAELDKRYACKTAPDNTLIRICALEDKQAETTDKLATLSKALTEVEEDNKKQDATLDKHWAEIEALKKQVTALSAVDTSNDGQIDATALLRKISHVEQNLKDKADKVEVVQARAYSDDQIGKAVEKLERTHDAIRLEISNFREDYALFKSHDFAALEARVAALEKRCTSLGKQVENIHIPEY